jgi:glycosyltransferase involved in cell wall biosynthesis
MRITIVVDRYYPHTGGIEQYVRGLCRQLSKDGHGISIITGPAAGAPTEERRVEGQIVRSPLLERALPDPGKILGRARQIAELIEATEPDVVYANNHASLGSIRAAKILGVPVVYGCHGWGLMCPSKIRFVKHSGELCHAETGLRSCMSCYADGPAPLRIKLPGFAKQAARVRSYMGFRRVLDSADARIGVSKLAASMFREQRNTFAIYPGLDLDVYRPTDASDFRAAYGLEGSYVLVPGRINPIKGQLDAVYALRESRLEAKIVFAGNAALDPDRPLELGRYGQQVMQTVRRLRLGDRVVFTGMLSRRQMIEAYSGATATLVPSTWFEPFGYVAAESMACGTPLVITSNSGAAELVDDSVGQTVPRQDPEAMAKALERVAGLGPGGREAARRRAVEFLGWPKVAGQVLSVLNAAAGRPAELEVNAA